MRILIVGGTQFIGPFLVRQLLAAGHDVAVFHRGQTTAALPAGVPHILGNRDRLIDFVAELRAFRPQVIIDMIAFVKAHALDLGNVFRHVAERVVVISSGDVYRAYGAFHGTETGPLESTPLTEDARLRHALYPYRSTAKGPDDLAYHYDKIPVEQAILSDPTLPGTVLRLPMVYGPRDTHHRLAAYLKAMNAGQPTIELDERLAGWRWTRGYVENVAAAITLAATDPRASNRVYNVGEHPALTEADWVRAIGVAADWTGTVATIPVGQVPVPGNLAQDIMMDTSRLRAELGYVEPVSPAEALRRTVAWERQHPADTHS